MITRRGFLRGTALAAGAAAVAAAVPDRLLDALADTPATGRLQDIDHFVFLIQENRSFDHYFGTLPGVRGFDDRSVTQPDGTSIFQQRWDPDWGVRLEPFRIDTSLGAPGVANYKAGQCTNDVDHQWKSQHGSWNGGRLDRWVLEHVAINGPERGPLTMGYYGRADLPFYHALADLFTVCDSYHCSVIGGTDINRFHTMTGTMDPDGFDGGVQFLDTRVSDRQNWFGKLGAAGSWKTYPELLQAAGISWKVYQAADSWQELNPLMYFKGYTDPSSPLFQRGVAASEDLVATFEADCLSGSLPSVSWIVASEVDSEHPPAPVKWGENISYRVLQALLSNPSLWSRTALVITYDENGGFFDHVPPPVPPRRTAGEWLAGLRPGTAAWTESGNGAFVEPVGLGFRVPTLIVSPYSRGGFVASDVFDHTSMLRLLETRFGVRVPDRDAARRRPGLSPWRRAAVGDLTSAFNFTAPDSSVPPLVEPNRLDPTVLAECTVTGEIANLADSNQGKPYPVPRTRSMPAQEPGAARRPSGPTAPAAARPRRVADVIADPTLETTAVLSVGVVATACGLAGWALDRRARIVAEEDEQT